MDAASATGCGNDSVPALVAGESQLALSGRGQCSVESDLSEYGIHNLTAVRASSVWDVAWCLVPSA